MKENLPRKTRHKPTISYVAINLSRSHVSLRALLVLPYLCTDHIDHVDLSHMFYLGDTLASESPEITIIL